MEHRNGKRLKCALQVELWCGDRRMKNGLLYDVGQGGLSLTGVSKVIGEGVLIKVRVLAGETQIERKAMVVYQRQQRLGLMWADVNSGFFPALTSVETIAA